MRKNLFAAPPRASSVTRSPPATSASTLASLHRWPISRSAAGKKVSLAFSTARAATPSNFSPNQRSSLSAGRARKPASSERDASLLELPRTPLSCHSERSEESAFCFELRSEEHTSELQSQFHL